MSTEEEYSDGDLADDAVGLDFDAASELEEFTDDEGEVDDDTDEAEAAKPAGADTDDEDVADDLDEDDQPGEEEEESLDVLLAREKAIDDADLTLDDSEPRDTLASVKSTVDPTEFTCRSCFLVKRRAQLADEERLICLDCA